jgi:predicted YcjX-like family ATPase
VSDSLWDRTLGLWGALTDASSSLVSPRLRIGVTGLSRSGKTVFTTALIHHLTAGAKLPMLRASSEGRISGARLIGQPDADVPRFPYEAHLASLMAGEARRWPESTRRISETSIEIAYESRSGLMGGPSTLTLDIVDYPGEWLLDLPLMELHYAEWAAASWADARRAHRLGVSQAWLEAGGRYDPAARADETEAETASNAFKAYLTRLRADPEAVAILPPGRFLMPGDLEGSPALTFAPLDVAADAGFAEGSLGELMQRRFEAYKRVVVKPFFRDHFARLDRQIVLVDVLSALNAGPTAVADLEAALGQVLAAFRVGRNGWLTQFISPRISKVVFAATKADHLHHRSHDRLEALMRHITERAGERARGAGAETAWMALAAIRATSEARLPVKGHELPAIVGVPEAGEMVGKTTFDGLKSAAVFPGELPEDPASLFAKGGERWTLEAPRFRPPLLQPDAGGRMPGLPHLRLDRALDHLIGDRLA